MCIAFNDILPLKADKYESELYVIIQLVPRSKHIPSSL
jgi:hypothetical protein